MSRKSGGACKRFRLSALATVLAVPVVGCGNSPNTIVPVAQICDGSQVRRLSVVVGSALDRVPGYAVLIAENGVRFFHVRGDCRYWVNSGDGGRYHSGVLGGLETELANDLFYGQWQSKGLTKSWGPEPGVFDSSPTLFSDGRDRVTITCTSGCQLEGAPSEIPAMWSAEYPWVERL